MTFNLILSSLKLERGILSIIKVANYGIIGMRPLWSLFSSVLGHFGPKTNLYIQFSR